MAAPLLDGRPGIYLVHSGHGGGTYFVDDPEVLEFYGARGWERADAPPEDGEEPKDLPESPAPKKTSKKAAAAAEKE